MKIVGHRGAAGLEPENTLRSFERALALGCEAIEFDVHLSSDAVPMVIHDESLDRTTNGVGLVRDLTAEDIRRLDAGQGEKVPTLDEVIDLAGKRAFLHVEIKDPRSLKTVVEKLVARGCAGNCRISSFWHKSVQAVKAIAPKMETGVLYAASPVKSAQLAIDAGADALHPHFQFVNDDLMKEASRHGLKVFAWTVDGAKEIEAMAAAGVDEVCTNRPDVAASVVKFLAEKKSSPHREKTPDELRMDAQRADVQALMKSKPDAPRAPGKPPKWPAK